MIPNNNYSWKQTEGELYPQVGTVSGDHSGCHGVGVAVLFSPSDFFWFALPISLSLFFCIRCDWLPLLDHFHLVRVNLPLFVIKRVCLTCLFLDVWTLPELSFGFVFLGWTTQIRILTWLCVLVFLLQRSTNIVLLMEIPPGFINTSERQMVPPTKNILTWLAAEVIR